MKYLISNINDYKGNELIRYKKNIYKVKQDRINKIINNTKQKQSIIGELQLMILVPNYNDLDQIINENGKPYFKNSNLYFNISHSYDYVITIIDNNEIGIDIEKIRKVNLNDIKVFATKKEQEYIKEKDTYKRLFQIYSLKEAYIKCLGKNINNLLDIEFIIDEDNITSNIKGIEFGFIKDINNYIISYAIKKE